MIRLDGLVFPVVSDSMGGVWRYSPRIVLFNPWDAWGYNVIGCRSHEVPGPAHSMALVGGDVFRFFDEGLFHVKDIVEVWVG